MAASAHQTFYLSGNRFKFEEQSKAMTSPITSIDMFNILRQKIGDKEAKALTEYIESTVDQQLEAKSTTIATKADITSLRLATKEDITSLRLTTKEDIANARLAAKEDIGNVRKEIAESKVDTIRWMIGLFTTLALMIVGLYFRK